MNLSDIWNSIFGSLWVKKVEQDTSAVIEKVESVGTDKIGSDIEKVIVDGETIIQDVEKVITDGTQTIGDAGTVIGDLKPSK